ncbi:MAG: hypothetical protein H7A15_02000 [Sinobacteraceae bacterium]|nr:hypothetical protein [Nevskiaceae bacterium]
MAATLAVAATLRALTAAFHEDGLADTCDAARHRIARAVGAGDHERFAHRQLSGAAALILSLLLRCCCWPSLLAIMMLLARAAQ